MLKTDAFTFARFCSVILHRSMSSNRVKIYTRTGDGGTSSLFNNTRRPKDDEIFEALGTTDELSSFLGLAREYCSESSLPELAQQLEGRLSHSQCVLQVAGSHIATPRNEADSSDKRLNKTRFDTTSESTSWTDELEQWIDDYDGHLPPLKNFILPSGGKLATMLHVSRSVCRRAERRIVPLVDSGQVDPSVLRYFNRLSDFLFTAARFSSYKANKTEVIYKNPN